MLGQSLELAIEDPRAVTPFNLHRLLIADSLKTRQKYMASLEDQLRDQAPTLVKPLDEHQKTTNDEQSNQVVLAKVGALPLRDKFHMFRELCCKSHPATSSWRVYYASRRLPPRSSGFRDRSKQDWDQP